MEFCIDFFVFSFLRCFLRFFKTGLRWRGREGRAGEEGRSAALFVVFVYALFFSFSGLTPSRSFFFFFFSPLVVVLFIVVSLFLLLFSRCFACFPTVVAVRFDSETFSFPSGLLNALLSLFFCSCWF